MFPFDQSSLPRLTTRRALILVDFQNDFLTPDGALPVTEPEGFVDRALELAAAFRASGDVVWVQSRFKEPRPADSDQILATDSMPRTARGHRSRVVLPRLPVDDSDIDPEAFLSHPEPTCLKPSAPGAEVPTAVKSSVHQGDMTLTKTHYSAFQDTQLLRMLRAKMVMEVFICGSLANVGVYATALGAAGHGLTITIVENCCGYRSELRQMHAVKALLELTGCEIASASEVLESITPKQPATSANASTSSSRPPRSESSRSRDQVRPSASPDIVRPMTGLRLASDSPIPADTTKASSSGSTGAVTSPVSPIKPGDTGKDNTKETQESKDKPPAMSLGDSEAIVKNGENDKSEITDVEPTEKLATAEKIETLSDDKPIEAKVIEPSSKEASLPSQEKKADVGPVPDDTAAEIKQKGLCAGDTDVIEDLLPPQLEKDIFYTLKDEISWQRMSHQGGEVPRLVAVQGEVAEDGSMPVYRHPSDESPPLRPFSPTVLAIKAETEKHLGHSLNHVLIQYYRDGSDYISEHSDKTLDIVHKSYIANVSLGAERIMVLRTKRADKDFSRPAEPAPQDAEGSKRKIQRARLPHNSLCRMGLQTNMQWLHSIRQDKRADRDKTPQELAYGGGRISLTFRQIGTFLDRDESVIWGQGATGKTREEAHPVINGQEPEAVKMLRAFGTENHASFFDWEAHYGKGFDVLHIRAAPRFFASGDKVVDMRIAMMLAEYGIGYAKGSMAPSTETEASKDVKDGAGSSASDVAVPIKFADNDASKSVVQGDVAIMLYINAVYGQGKANAPPADRLVLATQLTRFQQGLALLDKWRHLFKKVPATESQNDDTEAKEPPVKTSDPLKPLRRELTMWDAYAAESDGKFLAGSSPSLPDFAVWPILHDIAQEHGETTWSGLDNLRKYYDMIKQRENIQKVLGKTTDETPKDDPKVAADTSTEEPPKENPTKEKSHMGKALQEEAPVETPGEVLKEETLKDKILESHTPKDKASKDS